MLIESLTKTCKIVNNRVLNRLPIQCSLLEIILFEIQRIYSYQGGQFYLETMYKTLFALAYYGLMRVSEETWSNHVVKAKDVQVALNKDKIKLILYSSKTHTPNIKPQKIIITSNRAEKSGRYAHRNFCPIRLLDDFMNLRGNYEDPAECLFIFIDGQPVTPQQARNVLKHALTKIGLNHAYYGMHSFRVGRTTDLIKYGYSLDEVRRMGCWRTNTVFKYIRDTSTNNSYCRFSILIMIDHDNMTFLLKGTHNTGVSCKFNHGNLT